VKKETPEGEESPVVVLEKPVEEKKPEKKITKPKRK